MAALSVLLETARSSCVRQSDADRRAEARIPGRKAQRAHTRIRPAPLCDTLSIQSVTKRPDHSWWVVSAVGLTNATGQHCSLASRCTPTYFRATLALRCCYPEQMPTNVLRKLQLHRAIFERPLGGWHGLELGSRQYLAQARRVRASGQWSGRLGPRTMPSTRRTSRRASPKT